MTTLADDLAALIAAREAATKGRWVPRKTGKVVWDIHDSQEPSDLIAMQAYEADAAFIALAANVIEAHGAELAALVAENARLRAALLHATMRRHRYSKGCDGCIGVQNETRAALARGETT